jgi:hypothetical protein
LRLPNYLPLWLWLWLWLQAILLACCYPDDWPLLVVVPAGLKGVWAGELGSWIPPAHMPQQGHIQIAKNGDDLRRMLATGGPL